MQFQEPRHNCWGEISKGHLWDDGHFLAQGVQTNLSSLKTINHYSSLRFCQPEQGRDQGAFTSTSASNDANLQWRDENYFYIHQKKKTIHKFTKKDKILSCSFRLLIILLLCHATEGTYRWLQWNHTWEIDGKHLFLQQAGITNHFVWQYRYMTLTWLADGGENAWFLKNVLSFCWTFISPNHIFSHMVIVLLYELIRVASGEPILMPWHLMYELYHFVLDLLHVYDSRQLF